MIDKSWNINIDRFNRLNKLLNQASGNDNAVYTLNWMFGIQVNWEEYEWKRMSDWRIILEKDTE